MKDINCLRNNIIVNPPPLPLLCEISGVLHLGLMAMHACTSREAGRRNSGKILEFITDRNI